MVITNYRDYRVFLKAFAATQPKKGHGLLSEWARAVGVSTTLFSQIMAEKKSLSLEHAEALARHLFFSQKETDYLLLLVDYDRAGTKHLKDHFARKVTESQNEARLLKNRIEGAMTLTEEVKSVYYSTWAYAGIRNFLPCRTESSIDDIATTLGLPRQTVAKILEFLLSHGLAYQSKNGFEAGPQSTYISSDSPLVLKHHSNWRIKAIQQMDGAKDKDLFYTSPMSLSEDLALKLRKFLVDKIQEIQTLVGPSESEVVRCLNIDFFDY